MRQLLGKLAHGIQKRIGKKDANFLQRSMFWLHVFFAEYLTSQRTSFIPKLIGMTNQFSQEVANETQFSKNQAMALCLQVITVFMLCIEESVTEETALKV